MSGGLKTRTVRMRKTMPFPRRELPPLATIRQKLPTDHIDDVQGDVRRKLVEAGVLDSITPGSRIAITAGSRGMGENDHYDIAMKCGERVLLPAGALPRVTA